MRHLRKLAGVLVLFSCMGCSDDSTPSSSSNGGSGGGGGSGGKPPATVTEGKCEVESTGEDAPDSVRVVPCKADFDALASAPLDASLPGARSVKVVLDQYDDSIYFQNSVRYKIHYEFVSSHLSGGDLPLVSELSTFTASEYYLPEH